MRNHSIRWAGDLQRNSSLVIGHRGASAHAPENTLSSFRLAAAMGADAVELDVQLTKDKKIVVIHDSTLNRTTNGSGSVSDLSLNEIKSLDAGSYFHPMFAGERIPELMEVFSEYRGNFSVNVELKSFKINRMLVELTLECIKDWEMQDRVLISSFNPYLLMLSHKLAPGIPLGLLVARSFGKLGRFILRKGFTHQAYHPDVSLVTPAMIKKLHSEGKEVNCWTVNDSDKMRQVASWGVDGIITNYPDIAKRIVSVESNHNKGVI
jgi:glycerophosphoryl diester phosphodiesterase